MEHLYHPLLVNENAAEEWAERVQEPKAGKKQQEEVLWTRHSHYPHKFVAMVVICTYPRATGPVNINPKWGRSPWDDIPPRGTLAVNGCWGNGCHFCQWCTLWKDSLAPVHSLSSRIGQIMQINSLNHTQINHEDGRGSYWVKWFSGWWMEMKEQWVTMVKLCYRKVRNCQTSKILDKSQGRGVLLQHACYPCSHL